MLNKRRGIIIGEENRQGTPVYTVKAYLPVQESFGVYLIIPVRIIVIHHFREGIAGIHPQPTPPIHEFVFWVGVLLAKNF